MLGFPNTSIHYKPNIHTLNITSSTNWVFILLLIHIGLIFLGQLHQLGVVSTIVLTKHEHLYIDLPISVLEITIAKICQIFQEPKQFFKDCEDLC